MLLKCLNDHAFERYGRLWKCEETQKSAETYAVGDDLGEELLATGDFIHALPGVTPDNLDAAQAELSKSYRIVSIASPGDGDPERHIPTPRTRPASSVRRGSSRGAEATGQE